MAFITIKNIKLTFNLFGKQIVFDPKTDVHHDVTTDVKDTNIDVSALDGNKAGLRDSCAACGCNCSKTVAPAEEEVVTGESEAKQETSVTASSPEPARTNGFEFPRIT